MKSINPLIAIPSPRDIPEFIKAMDSITDIDKLWIKYSPSYITYPLIRKEFLENFWKNLQKLKNSLPKRFLRLRQQIKKNR